MGLFSGNGSPSEPTAEIKVSDFDDSRGRAIEDYYAWVDRVNSDGDDCA